MQLPAALYLCSALTLNRRRCAEPPSVPFEVPRTVLALPVGLIDGRRIDTRTSRTSPLVVRIDIIHMHEETRVRDVRGQRGTELMFRGHAMEPNRSVTRTDLTVNWLTFRVSRYTPGIEAEGIDEEIVSRGDVLVGENRNDSFETRHGISFSRRGRSYPRTCFAIVWSCRLDVPS